MAKPFWSFIPADVLDLEQARTQADAWARQQSAQLAQSWATLHLNDFHDLLAQHGIGPDAQGNLVQTIDAPPAPPAPPAPEQAPMDSANSAPAPGPEQAPMGTPIAAPETPPPAVDAGDRYLGPDGATPADVNAIGRPPPPTPGAVAQGGLDALGQGAQAVQDRLTPSPANDPVATSPRIQRMLDAGAQAPLPQLGRALVGPGPENVIGALAQPMVEQAAADRSAMLRGTPGEAEARTARVAAGGPQTTDEELAAGLDRIQPVALAMTGEPLKAAGAAANAVRGVAQEAGGLGQPGMSIQPFVDPVLRKIEESYTVEQTAATAPVKDRLERLWLNVTKAATDQGAGIAQVQNLAAKAAKAAGRQLAPDEMSYFLSRASPDRAAEVRLQEGLRPALQAVGDDQGKLATYLTLQDNLDTAQSIGRKVEQAERAKAKPPTLTDLGPVPAPMVGVSASDAARAATYGQEAAMNRRFSTGIDAAQSQTGLQTMAQELGPDRMRRVEQAAQQVWDFGHQLLALKRDAGIISDKLFDSLTQQYPHYVPTRIVDYLKDGAPGLANGKSLSLRDNGLRRLTIEGTAQNRENPLSSMVRLAYDTEAAVKRNLALNAFVKNATDAGLPLTPVPSSYAAKRGEQLIVGFDKGVKTTYALPQDVAEAIKQESAAPIPGVSTAMALFKMMATARNPAFLAGNVAIDAPTYVIRTLAREGGNPLHLPGVVGDLVKGYADAFQGVLSGTYKGDTAAFLKEGGGQFGFFERSQEGARTGLKDLARGSVIEIKNLGDLKRVARDLVTLKPVEGIGARIELGPRVAAYNRALKAGKSAPEAMVAGRSVTLDFAQGGKVAKQINQFVPFFNVGVQGMVTPFRMARDNPGGALLAGGTLLVAPTLAAEAWNRGDPQRAQDYADVPQYVKNQGVVIMLPTAAPTDETGDRAPQYLLVRLREYAPIVNLTREVTTRILGDDPQGYGDLLAGTLGALTPIQSPSQAVFPGVATAVQLAANKDLYRNRDIATDRNDEQASALSQGVAGGINAAAAQGGAYPNVRPSQVDFATRSVGSGVAGMVHGAADAVAGKKADSELPQDTPVVGGLANRFVQGRTGDQLERARQNRLSNDAKQMLYEAGLKPDVSTVKPDIGGVRLSKAEQADYQNEANGRVEAAMNGLMTSARFWTAKPDDQKKMVLDAVQRAHAEARSRTESRIGSALRARKQQAALAAAR